MDRTADSPDSFIEQTTPTIRAAQIQSEEQDLLYDLVRMQTGPGTNSSLRPYTSIPIEETNPLDNPRVPMHTRTCRDDFLPYLE